MESLSPRVVATAKLPILNPNKFDLWKMRIEQYFLMTDYSLWEVILNGDSPTLTKVVDGVVQSISPTTAKQRLAKKNELKASGTLLMALPDKHQLKFNIHKDVKSLMEAIEKRLGVNKETKKVHKTLLKQQYQNISGTSSESFDQIHDMLQKLISQLEILAEVKSSSSTSHNTQNLTFVSSDNTLNTNESVSVVPSVSAASTKASVSTLLNVDSLSDAVIYSFFASQYNSLQLDNEDLKQIDADDLEEMDLKWQMAMLTIRAMRFLQMTGRNLGANGTVVIGFDMSKCDGVGSFDWSFQAYEVPINYALMAFTSSSSSSSSESVEARLVVYQHNENVFEEDIKLLKLDVMLRDNALVELRKNFEKAKKEKDELKLTLEKFQSSLKNLSKLLESQITDKTGLRYDNEVFNSHVFDCDELSISESDDSVPISPVNDRYKSCERYHAISPPYTGIFMPPKPDLFFHDAPTASETVPNVFNVDPSTTNPTKDMSQSNRPSAPIIEDWVSDSEDESKGEPMPTQKAPSFVQTFEHVKTPRTSAKPVEHPKQAKNLRTVNHKSRGPKHSWNIKGNQQQALKDKGGKITSKGKTKTGKLDFDDVYFVKELKFNLFSVSQMCDKKDSVLFIDTECVVLSSDFKLSDENHVLLRVPRENNMYNVDLKNIVPSGDLTCLFIKTTLDESNLWHRRLGHINFKTMNKLVKGNLVRGLPSKVFENNHTCVACKKGKQHRASYLLGKFEGKDDEGFLVGYSVNSKAFRVFNSRTRIVQETLHINFLENQPNVAGSGPKWLFDIDTLTQSMNHQPVVAGNQPNHSAGIKENLDAGIVGKATKSTKQYVLLPLWFTGSKDPQNIDVDAAFDVKANENEVHISPSSSNQPKKHDEKAKREAKGKSQVDLSTGFRDLRDEFEEFFVNSTNRVNAASAPVIIVGTNPTNRTNSFNAASSSDNAVNMPTLEDIVYSDDEEDVGAEADFSNLETNISVSPILTTSVHKDHPFSQIIGELTTTPQTRSMARMELCKAFGKLMKDKFQISSMGELTFFLGLQVKKKDDGIFINQDKYVAKILKKFGLTDGKSASTAIDTKKPLLKDPDDEDVDIHIYRHIVTAVSYMINAVWSDERCCSLNAARSQASVSVKKTNDVVKLQALIDKKKVVITEDTIRQDLRLDDADV
nr:putative ribonuclease H-like domain-containing protein [Tanacetum cinerariifolium]